MIAIISTKGGDHAEARVRFAAEMDAYHRKLNPAETKIHVDYFLKQSRLVKENVYQNDNDNARKRNKVERIDIIRRRAQRDFEKPL